MAETDKFKQIKTNCKNKFTRFKTFLEKISKSETSLSADRKEEIKLRILNMEETWNEFDRVQTSLELASPDPGRETERAEVEEFYFRYVAIAKSILKESEVNENLSVSRTGDRDSVAQARIAQLEAE